MSADPTTKTALDLITGALRKTGQYAPGEAISSADANDALDVFNGLLDMWSNESLAVFNNNENIVTLTPGKKVYTVGTGADINIQRPLRITAAYSRVTTSGSGGVDFPCEVKDTNEYASIGIKSQPGPWPKWLYYNTNFPTAQMYFWPVPQMAVEFHFWTDMLLQAVNLTDTLALPQGYYMGLQFALAEVLQIEYGVPVNPDVRRMASQFKKTLKSNNASPDRIIAIDGAIAASNANNAGFILTGGF